MRAGPQWHRWAAPSVAEPAAHRSGPFSTPSDGRPARRRTIDAAAVRRWGRKERLSGVEWSRIRWLIFVWAEWLMRLFIRPALTVGISLRGRGLRGGLARSALHNEFQTGTPRIDQTSRDDEWCFNGTVMARARVLGTVFNLWSQLNQNRFWKRAGPRDWPASGSSAIKSCEKFVGRAPTRFRVSSPPQIY